MTFFQSLKERGLKQVHLVTSDHHQGLKNAIEKEFQSATWQRCHECPVGKRIFPVICWIKRQKRCNQP
uniref:transposase n=1 Tax=Tindallia magadiensis TaxID=69895 RepID=UPI0038CD8C76